MHVTIPIKKNRDNDYIIRMGFKVLDGGKRGSSPTAPIGSGNKACKDITDEWIKNTKKGKYKEYKLNDLFAYKGKNYLVDNKNVLARKEDMEKEKRLAKALHDEYGFEIAVLPTIKIPEETKTPDYYMNRRQRVELKDIEGESERTFKNALKDQEEKANAFMFNVVNSNISNENAIQKIKRLFTNPDTQFMKLAILIRDNKIIKVYKKTGSSQ